MARTFGSWLSGPPPSEAGDVSQGPNDYAGQRLGLPPSGSGSLVGTGRRVLAVTLDWLIAMGLGSLVGTLDRSGTLADHRALVLEVIWVVLGIVSVRLFSFTPGQLALGLQVVSVDHRQHVGIGRSAARVLLVALVIPALFTDADGRGFQDRLTATAVVRR
ncbi:RDD family protein [Mycobacterium sp. NPDC006124]|uniref:RDD family protein n=1 Tax=Mycobacterium sp. NPDC006124 TaxID=3156729 RepID=UPI0033A27AB5